MVLMSQLLLIVQMNMKEMKWKRSKKNKIDEASTSTIASLDALSPRHSKRRTDALFALLKEEAEMQINNNYSIVRIHAS